MQFFFVFFLTCTMHQKQCTLKTSKTPYYCIYTHTENSISATTFCKPSTCRHVNFFTFRHDYCHITDREFKDKPSFKKHDIKNKTNKRVPINKY